MHQMRKDRESIMDMAVKAVERAKKYVDENEHHYFKNYKPVGDVVVNESEMLKMSDAANKERCLPNTNDYDSKISIKLFGTAKYPTLHPPAPAHLLKLLLTIVFL